MTNEEYARQYANRIREEVGGMSEDSIKWVAVIICEALNERDHLIYEYLKNKIMTVQENPRDNLIKETVIATLELILNDLYFIEQSD